MKKKFAVSFLVVALCVCCLAGLSGCCGLSGHAWDGGTVLAEPDCSESGEMLYTCSECGETKTEKIIPKGHTYGEWVFEEGHLCTDGGNATRTCSTCNNTETKKFNASAHSYGGWETVTPLSCTTDGIEKRTCSICNHTETNTSKAKGHSFSDWTVTLKPTCTTEGQSKHTCSVCNHEETLTISATGHSFDEEITPATCTTDGLKKYNCSVCGYEESVTINATGHTYGDWKTILHETCTYAGEKKHTCTTCGNEETEIIPAHGHVDKNNIGVCNECHSILDLAKFTPVSTAADLKNIANNLSGAYYLTNDISLENKSWTPIGPHNTPFRGYLYGNGHTISDLCLSIQTDGGLFGYNYGVIDGVTIKNFGISLFGGLSSDDGIPDAENNLRYKSGNISNRAGLLTSYNSGWIKNCKIEGNNSIDSYSSCIAVDAERPFQAIGDSALFFKLEYHTVIGGFAGVNYTQITNCSVTGNFFQHIEATSKYTHFVHYIMYSQSANDRGVNISYATCGAIVGENHGTIESCKNDGNSVINAFAKLEHELDAAPDYIGRCFTYLTLTAGSIVGENSGVGNVCNTMANAITIRKSIAAGYNTEKLNDEYAKVAHADIGVNTDETLPGLIGSNSGKLKEVGYLS